MAPRPRPPSSPGPGRGGGSRRPSRARPVARRATRVNSDVPAARIASSKATLTGRATVLLLVIAVLAVSYASSMRAWIKQRGEINDLTAQIAQQKADVARLQQAEERWRDPAYIETQARLRFGWLMPGETGYRVIGPDGEVLSAGGSELSEPTTPAAKKSPEWWRSQWQSIVEAGQEPTGAADPPAEPARKPAERIGGGPRGTVPGSTDR